MAREITHEADGPYIIDQEEFEQEGGTVAICQCGLSANRPYCDGSHQSCADEDDDVVYRYEGDDDEGERTIVEQD